MADQWKIYLDSNYPLETIPYLASPRLVMRWKLQDRLLSVELFRGLVNAPNVKDLLISQRQFVPRAHGFVCYSFDSLGLGLGRCRGLSARISSSSRPIVFFSALSKRQRVNTQLYYKHC